MIKIKWKHSWDAEGYWNGQSYRNSAKEKTAKSAAKPAKPVIGKLEFESYYAEKLKKEILQGIDELQDIQLHTTKGEMYTFSCLSVKRLSFDSHSLIYEGPAGTIRIPLKKIESVTFFE